MVSMPFNITAIPVECHYTTICSLSVVSELLHGYDSRGGVYFLIYQWNFAIPQITLTVTIRCRQQLCHGQRKGVRVAYSMTKATTYFNESIDTSALVAFPSIISDTTKPVPSDCDMPQAPCPTAVYTPLFADWSINSSPNWEFDTGPMIGRPPGPTGRKHCQTLSIMFTLGWFRGTHPTYQALSDEFQSVFFD